MWREMVRQNVSAEKAYKEGARDTEESLRLTRESNETALRAIEIANKQMVAISNAVRASVVFGGISNYDINTAKETVVVAGLVNTGLTPALHVRTAYGEATLTTSLPTDTEWEEIKRVVKSSASATTIGAGKSMELPIPLPPLNSIQKAALGKGLMVLYCVGRIDYRDIFEANRWVTFYVVLDPKWGRWVMGPTHNEQG